ncbi:hypothetical protein GKQ38_02890 [Candidatus Nanohaloarchaea archaeon]|nr:hypothetical protein GKQ38_02890 [Candidatus Nanohaloarchaea archaeon]
MRKLLFLVFLAAALVSAASADVYHEASISKSGMQLNTSIELNCESNCPVNKWSLTWQIPKSAGIISVRDSIGRIEDYRVEGQQIHITTNSGPRRMNETVKIVMNVTADAEEIYRGLYKRELSLPGFSGEESRGVLHVDNLISGWKSYGFETSYSNNTLKFRGEGPVSLRVKFGEGNETRYYSFFGDYRGNTSMAYEISIGTTGVVQEFQRFPVASMPEDVYRRVANSWSAGEYIGGSMMVRQNIGSDYIPVLAHETVHGLNDREFNWDRTSSAYFDEGTAEYVEFLVRKKLSSEDRDVRPPGEVFGDDIRWDPDPSDNTYSLVPSRGDPEVLWNYYQNDLNFMKTWSSFDSEHREFGYAYSELIIKNYVSRGGRLSRLYEKFNVSGKVDSPERKWEIFSQYLDMTPCKYDSREKFSNCLDRINSYDYPVYSAEPSREAENLTIRKLDIPENSFRQGTDLVDSLKYDLQGLVSYLRKLLQNLL